MWSLHTMECYLAIKWNGILMSATTRMNLKNLKLGEKKKTDTKGQVFYNAIYTECLE